MSNYECDTKTNRNEWRIVCHKRKSETIGARRKNSDLCADLCNIRIKKMITRTTSHGDFFFGVAWQREFITDGMKFET